MPQTDSQFYNNVSVDSAWLALLQVNNTDFDAVEFYNNTFVQHAGTANTGILAVIFTSCSSGQCGGDLQPNTVFLTNTLFVLDGVGAPARSNDMVVTGDNLQQKNSYGHQSHH